MESNQNTELTEKLRKSLIAIKKLKNQLAEKSTGGNDEKIAVVGIGCRFPGSINTPGRYWESLLNGEHLITSIPEERWDIAALYDTKKENKGKYYTTAGGFMDDVSL